MTKIENFNYLYQTNLFSENLHKVRKKIIFVIEFADLGGICKIK